MSGTARASWKTRLGYTIAKQSVGRVGEKYRLGGRVKRLTDATSSTRHDSAMQHRKSH
jgi:hypothetical protein